MRFYQQRGEAAFVPDRASAAPPEIERPENTEEQIASLERLCGKPALELDRVPREVDLLKRGMPMLGTTTNETGYTWGEKDPNHRTEFLLMKHPNLIKKMFVGVVLHRHMSPRPGEHAEENIPIGRHPVGDLSHQM